MIKRTRKNHKEASDPQLSGMSHTFITSAITDLESWILF